MGVGVLLVDRDEVLTPWQSSLTTPHCGSWASLLQLSEGESPSSPCSLGCGGEGWDYIFFSVHFDWSLVVLVKKCSVLPGGHLPSALARQSKFPLGPFFSATVGISGLLASLLQFWDLWREKKTLELTHYSFPSAPEVLSQPTFSPPSRVFLGLLYI